VLLLTNKEKLDKFTKVTKIPEMIISFLFLATGIYLVINAAEVTTMMILKYVLVFASIPLAIIGFKKSKKPLAIIAVLLIIGAYGLAEMNRAKKVQKVAVTDQAAIDQDAESYDINAHEKALYLSQCALCHGDNGKKGLSGAKDLSISVQTEEEMFAIISNGKGQMLAYSSVFSKEEIELVIAYVKTLKVD
jgi:mono/diheme cytochrome c family protein